MILAYVIYIKKIRTKMKIVVLDGYTINHGDVSWKELQHVGDLNIYDRTAKNQIIERIADADAILTNKVAIDAEIIKQSKKIKYIGVMATGYNVVDIDAAKNKGIIVTNVPAYSTESVAQMVFAHILNITNTVEHYAILNRNGKWSKSLDFCYYDRKQIQLSGSTIGIIGLGNIGMRVAQIASAFGMRVIANTSKPQKKLPSYIWKCSISQLFSESDFITLHCPLTKETHHIISHPTIEQMKSSAIIINTGRGALVNEIDMANALQNGRIFAYCADVLEQEPPSEDNPLLKCDNSYITPHIAWATPQSRQKLINVLAQNLVAFNNGKPINVVN